MSSFPLRHRRFASLPILALLASLSALAQTPITPPQSTFFSTVAEEAYSTVLTPNGNGDLWPSCWADDGNLYAANGDGTGFGGNNIPMKVSVIAGTPPNLSGTTIYGDAGRDYTGMPFNGSTGYTDKPTGMLCLNGALYLAFQNINENDFEYAPAASIVMSTNHGATWSTPSSKPMFGSANNTNESLPALFTTIMFLDFGQNSANAIDGYVYAYGLDQDWRDQQAVYLARVPSNAVLTRSAWQFYTGASGSTPTWSSDITQKAPVITDTRLLYPKMLSNGGGFCPASDKVIAQGGAVYDAPLHRYLFASWSCSTHELYEAPQPWGPWSHISASASTTGTPPATTDFGPLHGANNRGQYGTSIPSKFISADGLSMYLQSNVCCSGDPGYTFALRKLFFTAAALTTSSSTPATTSLAEPSARRAIATSMQVPSNSPSNANLALAPGTRAISKSTHYGRLCGQNCSDILTGQISSTEDDFDLENKTTDWWGYVWPTTYAIDKVAYTTGSTVFPDGGWFAGNLQVQVRQNFNWVNVSGVAITPAYPYNSSAGAQTTYTFSFPSTWGDGVRIIGTPGGSSTFTAISLLTVTYGATGSVQSNLVQDPGFEQQTTSTVSSPWLTEGPDAHGIDRGLGFAHTGNNDAWIRDNTSNWNAITQVIAVQPNTAYTLTGWVQNNFGSNLGYFGVRDSSNNVLAQTSYSAAPNYQQLTVTFNSGSNTSMRVFAGFWGQNADFWIRLDDIAVQ